MKKYYALVSILVFTGLLMIGCSSNDATEDTQENIEENNRETSSQSIENKPDFTEIHELEQDRDISRELMSINYDGSIVFFNLEDTSGDDKIKTPYFYYDEELIDASSVGDFTECRFRLYESDTTNATGKCKDPDGTRVAVVYDVANNTITHATDNDRILYPLNDGRVLFTIEYGHDGTIYELTENGTEPFIEIDDIPSILDISYDQDAEVFFIDGANDDYWNAYVYDTTSEEGPVLFREVADDDEATTVEGNISPDGKYIFYRYRGITSGKHYNYNEHYIYNRETEEEIGLGQGFSLNFVRPNGWVIDDVRKYGQVIYNVHTDKWLAPEEADINFTDSTYANQYISEEDKEHFRGTTVAAISGDGETVLLLDSFYPLGEDKYTKLKTMATDDYINFLEENDVEIDFEPSPFDEKGA
ncbi:hypothetical protein SH601_04885 [Gracilibacillus sp. S3-1-1]|uniref:Uncharacterized protein n=1 Tax=Gracilibacillus pellucidus TaxID=3095368 RepID=A0ACC6M346_9BACI|nr:hypothetical protein [Gracilibacillus sp. S3-1-1]MDX8045318.1 hypothetical protein [Gracilibacillus sp. S3-1-1]